MITTAVREHLGTWGLDLSDDDLATALLVTGVAEAYRTYDADDPLDATVRRLTYPIRNVVRWRAPRLALEVIDQFDALDCGQHAHSLYPQLELDRVTAPLALDWQEALRTAEGVRKSYSRLPAADTPFQWSWPLRLGFLDDARSQELRTDVESQFYWPQLVTAVDADEGCDVLLVDGDSLELTERRDDLRGVGAGLVCVFAPFDVPGEEIPAVADRIAADVDAWGCHLTVAHSPADFVNDLVESLSHNDLLTDALVAADRDTAGTYTALTPELIDRSQLSSVVLRFAERLQDDPALSVVIPDDTAATLPTPFRGEAPEGQIGEWLEELIRFHGIEFTGESHEATGFAALMTSVGRIPEPQRAPDGGGGAIRREVRVFNGIVKADERRHDRALVARSDYDLDVWIGRPTDESITDIGAPVVPTDELPAGRKLIDVVFVSGQNDPVTQQKTLELDDEGDTDTVRFSLRPSDVGPFFGRLALVYHGRILQTAILRADVVARRPSRLGAPTIEVETVVRADLAAVDTDEQFDLAIVVNRDDSMTHAATVIAPNGVSLRGVDGMSDRIADLTDLLTAIADDPDKYDSSTSQASCELYYELAHVGAELHRTFTHDHGVGSAFFANRRVQLISAVPESLLPIEFFYRGHPPNIKELCLDWEDAVRVGDCPSCRNLDPSGEIPICLASFWSVAYIVERHAHNPDFVHMESRYRLQNEPSPGQDSINPLAKFVWAMSDNVNGPDKATMRSTLTQYSSGQEATSWADLSVMADDTTTMLFLVPHADVEGASSALEIGGDGLLRTTLIGGKLANVSEDARMLVVLLGCETAVADVPFKGFVPSFRRKGGKVVISTIATVLGRHAVPVAIELLALIKAGLSRPNEGIGDVLRQVRRQALIDGYPMVLAIAAFGDADWKIAS